MSTIHFHQSTASTPEQFVAGLTDFGPGRSELFPNSADGDLEVHHKGTSDADVTEGSGLSSNQVAISRQKYGGNSLPEDPPTPLWRLVLEQFKDQLVLILLGSAAISFVLALFEEGDDWTAFVDPVVVSNAQGGCAKH